MNQLTETCFVRLERAITLLEQMTTVHGEVLAKRALQDLQAIRASVIADRPER